jgi:dihydroflavonol-4-reductase
MRVLVTGATGFVGSHSTRALLAAGHEVRALVRDLDKATAVFGAQEIEGLQFVLGDITDRDSVTAALDDCEGLLHAAAVVSLDPALAERAHRTNTEGARNVLQSALDLGIQRIVYVSSLTALLDPDGSPVSVDGPVRTGGEGYAESKAESEIYVRSLQDAGAPIRITYPAGIIGPEDPGRSAAMMGVKVYVDKMLLLTTGGIQQIDVRDLAKIHLKLLEAEPAAGRHITAGHYMPWETLASTLEDLGVAVRRVSAPAPLLRALGSACDFVASISRFRPMLSREAMTYLTQWQPVPNAPELQDWGIELRPPAETLRDTIGWLRQQGYVKR